MRKSILLVVSAICFLIGSFAVTAAPVDLDRAASYQVDFSYQVHPAPDIYKSEPVIDQASPLTSASRADVEENCNHAYHAKESLPLVSGVTGIGAGSSALVLADGTDEFTATDLIADASGKIEVGWRISHSA